MESTYLLKEEELRILDKNGVNYYFYDAESFLMEGKGNFQEEIYFEDEEEEKKALKLLNRK